MKKLFLIIAIVFSVLLMQAQELKHNGFTFTKTSLGWLGTYDMAVNDLISFRVMTLGDKKAAGEVVLNMEITLGDVVVYLKFDDNTVFELDFWTSGYGETEILMYNDIMNKLLTNDIVKIRIHNTRHQLSRDFDLSGVDYAIFIEKYLFVENDFTSDKIDDIYRNIALKNF